MKSLTIFVFLFLSVLADPNPSEHFPHREILDKDGNYILYWKTNTTHITFEVHAKTRGYVGFGISPNGKMYPSDVVMGWIAADGSPYFKDYHTVDHVTPVVDQSQDWKLLHGEENSFGTSLKFMRPLKSCDSDDIEISDDTVHVIYAYHPDDPTSMTSLPWHGASRRGSKSLLLLSGTDNSHKVMPSDVKTFEFSNKNFHVPAKDTTYHCTTFQLPNLGKKHHMIKHEPIITKGNELHVHHFILYHCQSHVDSHHAGREFDCYHHRPREFSSCYLVSIAWAIGGEEFYFPSEAGYSLGTPSDPSFFMLETHYDNPTLRSDIIDSSGIRIYYTPTLRSHDAGVMETGVHVSPLQFVPPFEDSFVSTGFCPADALRQGMQSHPEGIKVFGVLQHSHLLGRAIKTRVVNNGVEKEPLAVDNHYDFDYQEIRKLRHQRTLVPGDSLIVDCYYNSSHKIFPTRGGLTTREEMCLSFLWYYPQISLDTCISSPMYNQIDLDPNKAVEKLKTWDWRNQTVKDHFNNILKTSDYSIIKAGSSVKHAYEKISYISPTTPYVPSPSSCIDSNNQAHLVSKNNNLPNPTSHSPVPTHSHIHQSATVTQHHASATTNKPLKSLNTARLVPTEIYTHMAVLDKNDNFKLYWKSNKTHITFETIVKTRGYVGFGISTNGKMFPADVIVGWVADDGTPHLNDYHTVGHVPPVLDKSQDWVLLHGVENSNGTLLKFSRKLDTCDHDDIKITDDTAHVIYSYHPDDPQSPTSLPWHGATRRGQKSMLLLSGPKQTNIQMPSDVKTYELLNGNYHVPGKSTTYHCTTWHIGHLPHKHHIIKYEPVITPGNELNVHHILIYHCMDHVNANMAGRSYECYGRHRPSELDSCSAVYIAWAIGGEAFYLPQNVGMSIGTSRDPTFFVMETHYDNPTMRTDMIDNSGIRVYYTPTLRQYDAGLIETGMHVNRLEVIPPYEPNFLTSGYCSENCLRKGMQHQPHGVKVFAVLQHAHLLGRKIRTRLIRNGVEQKPIASDNHYDFDYQDVRLLREERTILPGDSIIVECTHDSRGRTTPTYGGLSTQEEMCLTFLMYYPRMDVDVCNSSPRYDELAKDPFQAVHSLQSWNWTDPAVRQKFRNVLANSTHTVECAGKHMTPKFTLENVSDFEPTQKYTEPRGTCPAA